MAVMTPRHRRWFAALGGSIIVGALFAWLPVGASAADLRQGPSVTISRGQTINDDIYAAGGTISIDGNVNGSVIAAGGDRSEEHTSELQSLRHLVCRLLLEKKKRHTTLRQTPTTTSTLTP